MGDTRPEWCRQNNSSPIIGGLDTPYFGEGLYSGKSSGSCRCFRIASKNRFYIVLTSAYAIAGRWQEEYDLWDESRAKALLTTFGVRDLAERTFGTLSEGEKKRVQISRALMADPEVLLLDEPAAGLDLGGREDILHRITQYTSDEQSPVTIIVTHHIEEIPAGTTHALLLKDGIVAHAGPISQVLTEENITEVFGVSIQLQFNGARYFASSKL
jgi:iron complex transport system ATP-binding protein